MGAVPKRRISTGRKGRRRSAIGVKLPTLAPCPSCDQPKPPHVACSYCGEYKKEKIIDVEAKEIKKAAKEKAKKE